MQALPQAPHAPGEAPDAQAATMQCLRFGLGAETYALRVEAVREILEVVQMTPLPLMPNFVRGVMNLRGAVVPVIDLGARLGLNCTEIGRRTCVVIVDVADDAEEATQTLGVLVDIVHEVFDVTPADAEPVPRLGMRIEPGFVRNILRVRGQPTPELNMDAILDARELARLIAAPRAVH